MFIKKLSNDLSVGVFSELPEDRSNSLCLFYVQWKDRITGGIVAHTSFTNTSKSMEDPESLITIAREVLGHRDDIQLSRIDDFMTSSGAKEMRAILSEEEITNKFWGGIDND